MSKFRNILMVLIFIGTLGLVNTQASAQSVVDAPSFFIGAHSNKDSEVGVRAIIVSTEDQVLTGEIYSEELPNALTTSYLNVFEDVMNEFEPVEILPVENRDGVYTFSVELDRTEALTIYSE